MRKKSVEGWLGGAGDDLYGGECELGMAWTQEVGEEGRCRSSKDRQSSSPHERVEMAIRC